MNTELDTIIDEEITNLLIAAEMPASNLGFTFLKQAIFLIYHDPSLAHNLVYGLYPQIAKMYNRTYKQVERNIRYIIKSTYDISKFRGVQEMNNYTKKPKNGDFMSLCAAIVKKKINKDKLKIKTAAKAVSENPTIDELKKEVEFYKRLVSEDKHA